jgi:hypothetical protein
LEGGPVLSGYDDRIRCGKDTGLRSFPFRKFAANQAWLELVLAAQDLLTFFQRLCLDGEACRRPSAIGSSTSPAGWLAVVAGSSSACSAPGAGQRSPPPFGGFAPCPPPERPFRFT